MSLKRSAPYLVARQLALEAAHGVLFLLVGGAGKATTLVLMYHSIEVNLPWAVPAAMFRKQMLYVREHFRAVQFSDIKASSQRPRGAKSIIAVTFDDGRLDNYTHALPILEETGVKATFFITTGSIGGILGNGAYRSPMMDERQIRDIAGLRHEIGAHTVTHRPLSHLSRSVAHTELEDSKRRLEDLLGKPVQSLAYPYGDHNMEIRDCAAEVGFTCGGIVQNAVVKPQSDWLRVPRISVDFTAGSGLYFRAKASRAVEVFERIWGAPPCNGEYPSMVPCPTRALD